MKKFIMLAVGFEQPDKETMDAWMAWFASLGDKVVDPGNPLGAGKEVMKDGTIKELGMDMTSTTGYTIINAESLDEAVELAKGCPVVASMRVYEAMPM